MRVIIRRPHAYQFLQEAYADEGGIASATPAGCATRKGTLLPLPGLYVLDSDGQVLSSTPLASLKDVLELLDPTQPGRSSRADASGSASERVSIRVSGFIASEGIT